MILTTLLSNLFYLLCAVILLMLIAIAFTFGILVIIFSVKAFRETLKENKNESKENSHVESK